MYGVETRTLAPPLKENKVHQKSKLAYLLFFYFSIYHIWWFFLLAPSSIAFQDDLQEAGNVRRESSRRYFVWM